MKKVRVQEYLHQEYKIRSLQAMYSLILIQAKDSNTHIHICTHTQRIWEEERIFSTICILPTIKAQIALSQILLDVTRCSSSSCNHYLHTEQSNDDSLHPAPVQVVLVAIKATHPRCVWSSGEFVPHFFLMDFLQSLWPKPERSYREWYKPGHSLESEMHFTKYNLQKSPLCDSIKQI